MERLHFSRNMPAPKYVAAGLKSDLESLLTKFIDSNTLRFSQFAEIWREMRFSLVFMGRENETEMLELIGESFRFAQVGLKKEESEARQVGSLYILYGLFNKQPINPKARIRVTIDTWKVMTNLVKQALQGGHMDVAYIFRKLQLSGAFHFVATPSLMGPRTSLLEHQHSSGNIIESISAPPQFARSISESGSINELSTLHQKYQELKEKSGHPFLQSLKLVEDVGMTLASVLESITAKQSHSGATSEETSMSESEEESIQSRREAIRRKKMSASASRSRTKHSKVFQKDTKEKH